MGFSVNQKQKIYTESPESKWLKTHWDISGLNDDDVTTKNAFHVRAEGDYQFFDFVSGALTEIKQLHILKFSNEKVLLISKLINTVKTRKPQQ